MAALPTLVIAEDNRLESLLQDTNPTRAKASPRLTPPHSARSTPSSFSEESEKEIPSRGQETPFRGRPFSLLPSDGGASPFATFIHWGGSHTIDYGEEHLKHRLTSKDLSDSPEDLESSVLEPCPPVNVSLNVAEVLSTASTPQESDWNGFVGHRDTFAIRDIRHQKLANSMPEVFFRRLKTFIDYDTYLSVRLSCRCWSAAITNARSSSRSSSASLVPVEILQQIYAYLSPIDFNAARHTCRTWMFSSLDRRLLGRMLEIGGWWNASQVDIALNDRCGAKAKIMCEEWVLSKRLTTECSLRSDWTGNGLVDKSQHASPSLLNARPAFESFTLVSEIDFSALGSVENSGAGDRLQQRLRFTISSCGKYLLVTRDCTIYIYSLKNQARTTHGSEPTSPIDLVSTIICPHRILAVSMDTSFDRFSVAALLVGRVGLVCDLKELGTGLRWPKDDCYPWDPVASALWEYQAFMNKSGNSQHNPSPSPPQQDLSTTGSSSNYSTHPHSPLDPSASRRNVNIETGPYSLYYNLGSPEDPPLSVAICAQRQCVAFGCSTAIELHWVDAISGQGLNRWFPTSESAEVLHFFSERANERRLRVICSGFIPLPWAPIENGEYYNAIPLSDGFHAIFVNPVTAELCLGVENRSRNRMEIGAPYMKLETRVVFERPSAGELKVFPRFYSAGSDLRWGVRVVVGFGNQVWVFGLPGDWLEREKKDEAGGGGGGVEAEIRRISGIMVGEVQDLVAVGVATDRGGILVRGIGDTGLIREWRLGLNGNSSKWTVKSGGEVAGKVDKTNANIARDEGYEEGDKTVRYDADGDVIMTDARILPWCDNEVHDDDDDVRLDADGDVIMRDVGFDLGPEFDAIWHHIADLNDEELDEGYYSDEALVPWGGTVAIHPAGVGVNDRRNAPGESSGHRGDIGQARSVWEFSRCEVDVLGVRG